MHRLMMITNMSTKLLCLFLILFSFSCKKSLHITKYQVLLDKGWYIQSSTEISESGERISRPDYDIHSWYSASVPTTVLAALIKNGVYKEPFFGKNLEAIPNQQFQNSWWYRKEFILEEKNEFSAVGLLFEGINYRANIWINGKKLASADTIFGAFRMFQIDITEESVQGTNTLAVEVIPPKPGDFTIGFVDWNPQPPDKNMGIWREVKLRMSGPVSINNLFVHSKVDLNTLDEARLTVSADLTNHCSKKVAGMLQGKIGDIRFSQPFTLEAHQKQKIKFLPDEHEELTLKHPRLWWPHNFGQPHLYTLTLTASINRTASDVQTTRFGIREVSDYLNEEGHRGYTINGKKVLIRGGGWVDDLFLVEDPKKIEAQIKYAREMNLNAIRLEGFWGSSQTLYRLADQYGILVMPGWSCHWEWEYYVGKPTDKFGGIQTPEEMDLISRSLRDQVVWLRNHPSIFVWVLGSDKLPRPELEKKYNLYLQKIDPTRPTLAACSSAESQVSGSTGVKMNGPYDYVTPNYWYEDRSHGGAFGFNTETGPGPQPPPLESIQRMIPEDHLWPIDQYWDFHCARKEFNTLDRYVLALNKRYGKPKSVEEFARVAQVANYEAIRAMFESFGVNKPHTTGIIQWMYNSAWPSMFWQLFDYYLMPGGAFFGTKTGGEPLNIVYNYADKDIYLVNHTLLDYERLRAEIRVLNIEGNVLFSKNLDVSIGENRSKKIFPMPSIKNLSPVYFMDLKIKDKHGIIQGRNFYWLSLKEDILDERSSTWYYTPNKEFADFTMLENLPSAQIKVNHEFRDLGKEQEIWVKLENISPVVAFFIELNVYGQESGLSVLPIFWEDNYVSLLPGETREVCGRFSQEDLKGETPRFRFSGWNIESE